MKEAEDLLFPCPFCGGEAYISTPKPGKGIEAAMLGMFVECRRCGAHPFSVNCYEPSVGADSLVRRWNRRSHLSNVRFRFVDKLRTLFHKDTATTKE